MIEQKLVSIILPTFNRGDNFLKRAIDSVISQSYQNWELIIIDNNSKDNTETLVHSYENKKINFFKINNFGIISKSRNYGIQKSKGFYIAFLDSDDYWENNKLMFCINNLIKKKESCICHAENWIYPNNFVRKAIYKPHSKFTHKDLLVNGNCISLSAVILEKSVLDLVGLFNEDHKINTAEDYDLWLRIANKKINFIFIEEVLGNFLVHNESESSNILRNSKAVQEVISLNCNNNILKIKSISRNWISTGKNFHLKNSKINALTAYFQALKYEKVNFKIYFYILLLIIPHFIFFKIYLFLHNIK